MEPECVFYNILFDPAFFASDPELAALFDGWTRRDSRKLYSFGAGEADGLEALAAGLVCELTGGAPGAGCWPFASDGSFRPHAAS